MKSKTFYNGIFLMTTGALIALSGFTYSFIYGPETVELINVPDIQRFTLQEPSPDLHRPFIPSPAAETADNVTTTSTSLPPVSVPRPVVKPAPTTTTTLAPTTTTTTVPLPTPGLEKARAAVGQSGEYLEFTDFWCAEFVRYAWERYEWSDSPMHLAHSVEKVDNPVPGDLIFVNIAPKYSDPSQVSHVGIVESVSGEMGSRTFVTIEGNADKSGLVVRKVRHEIPEDDTYSIVSFGKVTP